MDLFIPTVIITTPCPLHGQPTGYACHTVKTDGGLALEAICNDRALAAGFNGYIQPRSIRTPNRTSLPGDANDLTKGRNSRTQPAHRR